MTLRRLLNVVYAALLDYLGGGDEARDAIARAFRDQEESPEQARLRAARENQAAVQSLMSAFQAG